MSENISHALHLLLHSSGVVIQGIKLVSVLVPHGMFQLFKGGEAGGWTSLL